MRHSTSASCLLMMAFSLVCLLPNEVTPQAAREGRIVSLGESGGHGSRRSGHLLSRCVSGTARRHFRRHLPRVWLVPSQAAASARGRSDQESARPFGSFASDYEDMAFIPPRLSTIRARTLIVNGDQDWCFPVSMAAEMAAAIPSAYLWVIPNGRHVPVLQHWSRTFTTTAVAFLSGKLERG
jgi:pimeloyl-ACP methyl ester carboxylesterase